MTVFKINSTITTRPHLFTLLIFCISIALLNLVFYLSKTASSNDHPLNFFNQILSQLNSHNNNSIDNIQTELSYILHNNRFYRPPHVEETVLESLISSTLIHAAVNTWYASYNPLSNDFLELARQFQSYSLLSSIPTELLVAKNYDFQAIQALKSELEMKLFPWFPQTSISSSTTASKGIVLLLGNNQFQDALLSIHTVRYLLKSELPIEIFYGGPSDLEQEKARTLEEKFSNTTVRDLFDVLPALNNSGISGWAMKPFAMVASTFQHVVFMDADSIWLQDPAAVFDFKGYKRAGSVFFHDRLLLAAARGSPHNETKFHKWLKSLFFNKNSASFNLSPDADHLRSLQYKLAKHEQESGVVVINKKTTALHGLLLTCTLLMPDKQTTVFDNSYGDKEAFWIAAELIKIPYYFVQGYGGAIGVLKHNPGSRPTVCGSLLHIDENFEPLWWNGGAHIINNKKKKMMSRVSDQLPMHHTNMTHWATDKMGDVRGRWVVEDATTPYCYTPFSHHLDLGLLSDEELYLTASILAHAQ